MKLSDIKSNNLTLEQVVILLKGAIESTPIVSSKELLMVADDCYEKSDWSLYLNIHQAFKQNWQSPYWYFNINSPAYPLPIKSIEDLIDYDLIQVDMEEI